MEKEAFAVVESMTRLHYLTAAQEVSLFTDHSNLIYIFDPYDNNPGIGRHVANKLMRWALKLSSYRYVIEHRPGSRNVWADILTRWAVRSTDRVRSAKLAKLLYAPIAQQPLDDNLDWPNRKDIFQSQLRSKKKPSPRFKRRDGIMMDPCDVVWIPQDDDVLKLRILIASHAGRSGHRDVDSTKLSLRKHFYWDTMKVDVESFCNSCIHCLITSSGQ